MPTIIISMFSFFTDFLFKHSSYSIISPLYDVDIHAPYYFMVEGIDGVGKSTFCESLRQCLNISGVPSVTYHEPFDEFPLPDNPTAEDFQRNREEFYRTHRPDGQRWIISDRSLWSTVAYNDCSNKLIKDMERWYEDPEYLGNYNKVLFYLTARENVTIERLKQRGNIEPIERDRKYQLAVKKKYQEIMSDEVFHLDVRMIVNTTYNYPLSDTPSLLKQHHYLDTNFTEEEIRNALYNRDN